MSIGTKLITTKPSFWSGMVRTFDLFGTYEEYNLSALDTYVAWKHDWEALSKDFRQVMGTERLVEAMNHDRENSTSITGR